MNRPALLAIAAFCAVGAACGGSSGSSTSSSNSLHDPTASGVSVAPEVDTTVHLLPEGTIYISVTRGTASTSPPPAGSDGVLYVDSSGQSNAWYFFSARPVSQRGTPNPSTGTEAFATTDLPLLPNVNQHEALLKTDLVTGGRTQAHKSGGVEVVFVIAGSVEVHGGTFPSPKSLRAGQGAFVLENTPLQVFNTSGKPATVLDFYLVPGGKPLSQPFDKSV